MLTERTAAKKKRKGKRGKQRKFIQKFINMKIRQKKLK